MQRLGPHGDARLRRAYVTPQARLILRCAPAICVDYAFILKAYLSNSHLQKQNQAASHVSTESLRYGNARVVDSQQRLFVKSIFREIEHGRQRDGSTTASTQLPPVSNSYSKDLYWQKIPIWRDVSEESFRAYKWQTNNVISDKSKLLMFLKSALPEKIFPRPGSPFQHIKTRDDFIKDVFEGIEIAPMATRLTPHVLSVIDWNNPLEDPIRRQFIPMKSSTLPDHPMLTMDSLNEENDSPVNGLVHRYPDKALFLATSVCPLYCRFCTRSYNVGTSTNTVVKKALAPNNTRWERVLAHIEATSTIKDVVVSGGDCYFLAADELYYIGARLISIKHVRRIRFASKGLAVWPSRIANDKDRWTRTLIEVTKLGRTEGKAVALHTHFNHPSEVTWITSLAAERLFKEGVTVRNQTVLLRGVNDDVRTMSVLISRLADINIQPYYVYQGDMVKGVEDLRTPLQTILDLETQLRGTIAGFLTPQFVLDLPGGGGKRLAACYRAYDKEAGISTFIAPAVTKGEDKLKEYKYYDPLWSLGEYGRRLFENWGA